MKVKEKAASFQRIMPAC